MSDSGNGNGNGFDLGGLNSAASRHEKSLGLLTTRFVSLLQDAKDGVLDLKKAADTLAVRQKRRIYDITNVLEGIGLIEKKSKNSIQWLGAGPGCNTREITEQLLGLKEELVALESKEMELDQHFSWAKQSINNITDDIHNKEHSWVKHNDFAELFPNNTLLVIQAPSGSSLEVPMPRSEEEFGGGDMDQRGKKRRYQMRLKSRCGAINVFLVNREAETLDPVLTSISQSESETEEEAMEEEEEEEVKSKRGKVGQSIPNPAMPIISPVRQLSPRKAASQHLFVQSKRTSAVGSKHVTKMKKESPKKKGKDMGGGGDALVDALDEDNNENKPLNIVKNQVKKKREVLNLNDILPDILQPLLRLSPPPNGRDYCFNLEECEGAADLFDLKK